MRKISGLLLFALACGGQADDPEFVAADGTEGLILSTRPSEETGFPLVLIPVYDEPEEEGYIGTLEQALTIPNGYGLGTGDEALNRCWSGVGCIHPGTKTYSRKFYASTCSSWYQAQFVRTDRQTDNVLDASWTVNDGTKNKWYCGTNADAIASGCGDGALGCAIITYNGANGKILNTKAYIYPPNIEAQGSWAGKTDTEHSRFVVNAIMHEVFHTLGLGHMDDLLWSVLMAEVAPSTFYQFFFAPAATELGWLKDYKP